MLRAGETLVGTGLMAMCKLTYYTVQSQTQIGRLNKNDQMKCTAGVYTGFLELFHIKQLPAAAYLLAVQGSIRFNKASSGSKYLKVDASSHKRESWHRCDTELWFGFQEVELGSNGLWPNLNLG